MTNWNNMPPSPFVDPRPRQATETGSQASSPQRTWESVVQMCVDALLHPDVTSEAVRIATDELLRMGRILDRVRPNGHNT